MGAIRRLDLFKFLFLFSITFLFISLSYFIMSFLYLNFLSKIDNKIIFNFSRKDSTEVFTLRGLNYLFNSNINNKTEQIAETKQVKFTLLGTLVTDRIKSAMLKIDNEIKIFRLNQNISDKTRISRIEDFFIEIDINGKKQIVELNRDFRHEPSKENLPPLSSVVPIPQGAQNFVIDKRLVEEMTKDVGQFLKDVRIIPYFENGVTAGFKFDFVRQGSLLEQNGIKQGDKIVSINGNPVKTTEDSFKLYNMLRTEKYISLVLEDQNGKRTLNYEIR